MGSLVLGIETSCDETSAAVLSDRREILSSRISSQTDLHSRFGGVVPEVAARRHVEAMGPMVQTALEEAGCWFGDLGLIAVTNRPGLIGALLVGVAAAKAFSLALGVPLVGVHHLEAHIYANFIGGREPQFPVIALIVSGGHTDLVLMTGHGEYQVLGRTRDDAAGEAFDKSARAMGLGYPGGPLIDRLARTGDPTRFAFPRANLGESLDFSFSGLKTALLLFLRRHGSQLEADIADVAASFQEAVVDPLVNNTMLAVERTGVRRVLLAGGVAANSRLREKMAEEGRRRGVEVSWPPPSLCTDNAAMIACAGAFRYAIHGEDGLSLETFASEPLGTRV
ncbi:MAG: tRNA (adenosine(37)-N6)-threonylcarbamoyltransferase complex transferase subunit TsaD [Armatimonadota bacterium]